MVMKLQNLWFTINPHDSIVVSDADDEWCLMINDMLTSFLMMINDDCWYLMMNNAD